ncbi:hypothetical protein F5Y04DRAFT_196119 [Hypomontagnella monticulosa]|nr:hypothetical protein F5Y04DRAFT_196119 [Hypomontagnella monticulosa]
MTSFASSSPRPLPRSNFSRQDSPTKSKLQTAISKSSLRTSRKIEAGSDEESHQVVEQMPATEYESPTLSRGLTKKQPPSVADLRKSFERHSQEGPTQTPNKPRLLPGVTHDRSTRKGKDVPHPFGAVHRSATSLRMAARNDNEVPEPSSGLEKKTSRLELRSKTSERSLPGPRMTNTLKHPPAGPLPKSSRFRRGGPYNFDGAISVGHDADDEASITDGPTVRENKKSSRTSLGHWTPPASSKPSFRVLPRERPVIDRQAALLGSDTTPRRVHKSGTGTRCTGRVSDLRRLFERSSPRGLPPRSIKSIWQNRNRNKPVVELARPHTPEPDPTESSSLLTVDMSPIKRISIPELTTEISTGDFSCDFTGSLDDVGLPKLRAHFDTEVEEHVEENRLLEPESPVKGRIQQFERLSYCSPATSPAPRSRASSYDAGPNRSSREKENDSKQIKTRASWHPFKQRSVELWRRISNSFTRSVDGESSHSHDGENVDRDCAHIDEAGPSSVPRRLRYRRSDLIGFHLYSTSEIVHSSASSVHSRLSTNINDELIARFRGQVPSLDYSRSSSRRLSMRRTFPFLARMSEGLGCAEDFDDFGLDGAFMSKVVRHRSKSPVPHDPIAAGIPSSSPTTHSNANALSRMVSKQTTAERKRRRLEEKQLRQEQRDKKREDKMKDKGKGKATANEEDENNEQCPDSAQDKGKGKEGEGKKKESSWSKKTASGFVVRQIHDVKLRHPKPRRPGQVKKIVNMYKEKASSGIRFGKGSSVGSRSGTVADPASGQVGS